MFLRLRQPRKRAGGKRATRARKAATPRARGGGGRGGGRGEGGNGEAKGMGDGATEEEVRISRFTQVFSTCRQRIFLHCITLLCRKVGFDGMVNIKA